MCIRKRQSDRSGRALLPSPGRTPVAGRGKQSRFWLAIAAGMSSEDAAVEAGVHSAEEIAAVATALNSRPGRTLGWKTPAGALDEWLR
jgi:hypothetical protein